MAKTLVYKMWAAEQTVLDMTEQLTKMAILGATHVYVGGLMSSPQRDGYGISNYMCVDFHIGTMGEFKEFVERAHEFKIEVIIDLVLNHTSTQHPWFAKYPRYYCWTDHGVPGWLSQQGGDAWWYDENRHRHYLSSFGKERADLRWFEPNGEINQPLVEEFQRIVKYWREHYGVDGFCLDTPQLLNKDYSFRKPTSSRQDIIFGDKDEQVINALFPNREKAPFLMAYCYDPTFGDLIEYYAEQTPLQFLMNPLVHESASRLIAGNLNDFLQNAYRSEENQHFMLHLEDHDTSRFSDWAGVSPVNGIFHLLNSQAQGICLYQGQESYPAGRSDAMFNYVRHLVTRWYHL